MPSRSPRIPSYGLHKPTGQTRVRIDGRDVYLGRFDSDESRERYRRVVAEWLSTGTAPEPSRGVAPGGAGGRPPGGPTVAELLVRFLRHAEVHYRHADGTPTGTTEKFKVALRLLRSLYARTAVADFGPKALNSVRAELLRRGLSRSTINFHVGKVVQVFKWGVAEELVPPAVYQAIVAVPGLRRGRTEARETKPVGPVPEAYVEAVLPHVSRQVRAMIEIQRLTGMRPGEVVSMRTADLDTSGRLWVYRPARHKTEHHGRQRVIYLGPKAQGLLGPWVRTELEAPLFSPAEADAEFRSRKRAARKSKVQPSQRARRKASPKRRHGDHYSVGAYG
ncbi:site-specific integrase [Tautonia plasticadhaerens]|uniref:Phage integrase family protein n=1 Tax=Tautonia plasticadhaerens TaxID=2527974 RepID=A0A518H1G0_9BACT|nr:site-specific integrase [Tautonia plasticadhaerens]QDV34672.1 Phage integrase family protein [Tautonia plasticadhaerens]